LPELPQLQEIVLNDTLVFDEGLIHLGKYAREQIWLENTKINTKGSSICSGCRGWRRCTQNSPPGLGLAELAASNLRFISRM
jgi:hypothetical protein